MQVRALRREMLRYQRLDFEKWTTQRPCGLWGASTERRVRKGGVQDNPGNMVKNCAVAV